MPVSFIDGGNRSARRKPPDVRRHFQQYFSYILDISFILGGNLSTLKTTDLSQVTDKLYPIMLYRSCNNNLL
jgi:hypothetical protein